MADQSTSNTLAPSPNDFERVRLQEHLNFLSSELHKAFGPLFNPQASDEEKHQAQEKVINKLDFIDDIFSDDRTYLQGNQFSIADALLFVMANWCFFIDIDLQRWPNIYQFHQLISKRPSVQAAMKAEGLI